MGAANLRLHTTSYKLYRTLRWEIMKEDRKVKKKENTLSNQESDLEKKKKKDNGQEKRKKTSSRQKRRRKKTITGRTKKSRMKTGT